MHGGKSTGPTTAAGKAVTKHNAVKHGVYLNGFTPEELADLEAFHANDAAPTLLEELNVARIQLRRAWIAAARASSLTDPEAGLDVIEARQGSYMGVIESRKAEVIKRRPDMWIIVDRCLRTYIRAVEAYYHQVKMREMEERIEGMESRLPQTGS